MPAATMRELLDAGVHFGHRTARWNPKMRPYIFGTGNGIHVVDLKHTVDALHAATAELRALAANRGDVIFVGTKRQAQEVVREEAQRSAQHYVDHRWLGGTLTNFDTLRLRLQRLRELQARQRAGDFERLAKKDAQALVVELNRLLKRMGGIRNLTRLPDALFIIDPKRERNAIAEARRLGIRVVALTDTNCDPDDVDLVIPGNDDAIRSILAVTKHIADALLAGREEYEKLEAERVRRVTQEAEAAMAAAAKAAAKAARSDRPQPDIEAAMLSAAAEAAAPGPSRDPAAASVAAAAAAAAKPKLAEPTVRRVRRKPAAKSSPAGAARPRAARVPKAKAAAAKPKTGKPADG